MHTYELHLYILHISFAYIDMSGKGRGRGAVTGKGGARGQGRGHNCTDGVAPSVHVSSSHQRNESGEHDSPLITPVPPIIQQAPCVDSNGARDNSNATQSSPMIALAPSTMQQTPNVASNDAPDNSNAAQSSNRVVPTDVRETNSTIQPNTEMEDARDPDGKIHLIMKGDT